MTEDYGLQPELASGIFFDFVRARRKVVEEAQLEWQLWAVDLGQYQNCKTQIYRLLHEWRVKYVGMTRQMGYDKKTVANIDILLIKLIMP